MKCFSFSVSSQQHVLHFPLTTTFEVSLRATPQTMQLQTLTSDGDQPQNFQKAQGGGPSTLINPLRLHRASVNTQQCLS